MADGREGSFLKIVFFDVGGTLLEVRELDVWAAAAERIGLRVEADHLTHAFADVVRETDVPPPRPTFEQFWGRVLERASGAPVTAADVRRFLGVIGDEAGETMLYSDVRRCLEDVRALGLRTGVISNSASEARIRRLLHEAGILDGLDPILVSGTEGVEKPDPEIFRRAVQRAGVAPAQAFFVGDLAFTDAKAAMAAGLSAVWLNREGTGFGDDPPEITSLTELAGHLQMRKLVALGAPVK